MYLQAVDSPLTIDMSQAVKSYSAIEWLVTVNLPTTVDSSTALNSLLTRTVIQLSDILLLYKLDDRYDDYAHVR